MSSIVQFPMERTLTRSRKPATGGVEIIIFPGVRIERQQQAARTTLARKRRNTQVAVEPDFEQS